MYNFFMLKYILKGSVIMNEEYYKREEYSDFALKLYRGGIIPKDHPNFNNHRVEIEIYGSMLDEAKDSKIEIEGKIYTLKSQNLLNKIKEYVRKNLETLINWSIHQNNLNLDNNAYEGGMGRSIRIKYGQLIINVNGQVRDIGDSCDQFINEIVSLIENEADKAQEDYINELFTNTQEQQKTPLDEEFEKYCKLYEEKFGKKAYIAEPSGSKQQTIDAIKTCLEENEDLLDKLLYPNFDKDMEDGVLY